MTFTDGVVETAVPAVALWPLPPLGVAMMVPVGADAGSDGAVGVHPSANQHAVTFTIRPSAIRTLQA